MALTASALVIAAKQRAFGVTGSQKISDSMLLEELGHQDILVVQMFSQIAPDLLAVTTGSIIVNDAGNTAGYTLLGGMHYRDFTHVDPSTDKYTPINMVQRQHRQSSPTQPAGMLRTASGAAVFYPIDPKGKRWVSTGDRNWFEPAKSHEFAYSFIAIPAALTKLSDTLASPDMAREVFVTALEVRILLANPRESEVWTVRTQAAVASLQTVIKSLRMQAYKFMQPQGQPGGNRSTRLSDTDWVSDQVVG